MKPKVLLIEDNEANTHLARFLLEKAGCQVLSASDGRSGLALAASANPDLVVLDIQMPELDGYEVASRLKAEPATASVPIMVVTSYAQAGDRERALALGVSDYLEKPFEPPEFIERARRLLGLPPS